jgi:hypothetical protein
VARMIPDDLVRRYEWVRGIEAWTIAVVHGRTVGDVVEAYGGNPTSPIGELTFAGVEEHRGPDMDHLDFYLQVLEHGGQVVAIENNGYSGAFPEIARRCARGRGRFFSVYWSIAAAGMVTQAVDGVITARFEPLYPFDAKEDAWERRPGWAIGPPVDVGLAWQVCMAQLERQTGIEVEERWLREPYSTYRIPDPYGLYRHVDGADRA